VTSQLVSTPSNMVSTVRNAIDSYLMGPLRALAHKSQSRTPLTRNQHPKSG
jgi:uncharacterized protein YfaA (DUF2138 family)